MTNVPNDKVSVSDANRNKTMRDRDEPLRCEYCEDEIGADETVCRVRERTGEPGGGPLTIRCWRCYRNRRLPAPTGGPDDWNPEDPDRCRNCGRPVWDNVGGRFRHDLKPYCDARCRREIRLELRRKMGRLDRRELECETCGDLFTPERSDAKYCGGACRQKAYRERKDGD